MALTAEREAYLRLAAHSMDRSEQLAPHFNIRSPKAYGGYVVSNQLSKRTRFFFSLSSSMQIELPSSRHGLIGRATLFALVVRLSASFDENLCSIGARLKMLLFD